MNANRKSTRLAGRKMSKCKEYGGMGLEDLRDFNMVLLAEVLRDDDIGIPKPLG